MAQCVLLYSVIDGMLYDYIRKVAERMTKSGKFYGLNVK